MFLFRHVEGWSLKKTIILGLFPRLLLMPFVAHPFDVYAWYVESMRVLEGSISFSSILASLRPLWLLTLIPVAYLYGFLSSITGLRAIPIASLPSQMNPQFGASYIPDPLFNFLVKVPMLVADIATTVVLYRIVTEFSDGKMAGKTALLYYLNPILIWISAAWGQYESIIAFFTVLSLYFLLKKKMIYSAMSLLTATLYKTYPAIFIIPVTIYLVKRTKRTSLAKYYAVFFAPVLLYLIVGGTQAFNSLSGFILGFFSIYTFAGLFGYGLTYWSVSMLQPLDPNFWAPISSILIIVVLSLSLYYAWKAKFNDPLKDMTVAAFLIVSAMFLSCRYIGETRLIFLLPFLILMLVKKDISMRVYASLSLIAFLYTQKNFPYYLLPIATINKDLLMPLFKLAEPFGQVAQNALMPTALGAVILATLGVGFSILLLSMYTKVIRVLKKNNFTHIHM